MDLKDPKTQKILLGVLILFLMFYFWYARVYSKNLQVISQKQAEYENILTNLKNVEMKAKNFESLKAEYEKLLERYKGVELLLPEEEQVPWFLTQMHFAAQSSQTSITQIIPQAVVPIDFYNASSFNVEIAGSYHNFGNFLSDIANFPFIACVSGMTITGVPQQAQASKEEKNTITASFKLTTYYIQEKERLQQVEF
jgi:type IV pilus assembly protein PilO